MRFLEATESKEHVASAVSTKTAVKNNTTNRDNRREKSFCGA